MILSDSYSVTPAPLIDDRGVPASYPQYEVSGLGSGCSCAYCVDQANSLSLERFRELFVCEINPWHFYGLGGGCIPKLSSCSSMVREHRHQGKWAGRRDIVAAIKRAEDMLSRYLDCPPGPRWVCDEVPWPKDKRTGNLCKPTHPHQVKLRHGCVHAVGKEIYEPIGSYDAKLVDLDEDACPELFCLSVPLDHLPDSFDIHSDELSIFFTEEDRFDPMASFFRWEIKPISVRYNSSINPTHVEIWGKTWLIVRPLRYMNGLTATAAPGSPNYKNWLDISDLSLFASQLTVYGKVLDHTHAGNGVWVARNKCCETPTSCQACEAMNFCILDGKEGKVTPLWSSCGCGTPPDRLRISYLAGDKTRKWERIIGQLAIAELACSVCECGDPILDEWHEDLARSMKGEERNNISRIMLRNPLGTRRGHVAAWQMIRDTDMDGLDGILVG